jgi:uncharacterized protein (TIGR00369 family)
VVPVPEAVESVPTAPAGPTPVAWGDPRTRVVTWFDPAPTSQAGAAMSGLDFIRAIRDGVLARPPMASVFDFAMTEVEVGRVTFECTPDESAYNPIGMVHGGLVCTLADSVLGCAVHTTLDAGVAYTSVDLNVSYLRPVTIDSGRLRATGTVIKPGRKVAFGRAEILDAAGKVVATATGTCLVMGG